MNQSNLGGIEYLASRIFVRGHEYIPSPQSCRAYKKGVDENRLSSFPHYVSRGRLFSHISTFYKASTDYYSLYFYIYINRITNRITRFCNS